MFEFEDEEINAARKFFAGQIDFMRGIQTLEQLPPDTLPEIAFAGRSNVGKSSLINAVTGRKALARTSNTPGRTQQLNFFDVGGRLCVVDMPGYGYAKVSKKDRNHWQRMIKDYLRGRVSLKRTYVLIDGRHGIKDSDTDMMDMLDEAGAAYTVVLTKCDKMKKSDEIPQKTELALKKHAAAFPYVFQTSAMREHGIDDFRAMIYREAMML